ncbi:MAG: zf-HC2 domain-containing protein [Bacteroidales bacterium]|nr:zf-HC2 domain-containing protein [Bacteroidales bacterium]MBN2758812.1 zf-HC2 domain-containing protein [Bacteroidales bacterium]
MKCKEVNKELIFYTDNNLSKEKKQAIENHLKTCAHCRNLYNVFKESFEIIEKEKIKELDSFFYSHLSEKINQIENKKEKVIWLKSKQVYFQAIAASLIIFLSIYSGIFLGTTNLDKSANYTNSEDYELFAESYNLNQNTKSTYEMSLLEIEEKNK